MVLRGAIVILLAWLEWGPPKPWWETYALSIKQRANLPYTYISIVTISAQPAPNSYKHPHQTNYKTDQLELGKNMRGYNKYPMGISKSSNTKEHEALTSNPPMRRSTSTWLSNTSPKSP